MEYTNITIWGLGIGMILMLLPVYFFWKIKTGLLRATLTATARMMLQLFLMSIYFRFLFLWNNLWVNCLWALVMVVVACYTFIDRTGLMKKMLLFPVFVGFLVTAVLIGMFFLVVVMQLDQPFEARYFIPVMGILLGNMLSVNVVAMTTYFQSLQREQSLYYYLLGNGASRFEATQPFLKKAIVKSFSPCIANMAVLGIVSMPGTMIGQMLGGTDPDTAIRFQLMIVVITISASILSLMITIYLASWRVFDSYGILKSVFICSQEKECDLELF